MFQPIARYYEIYTLNFPALCFPVTMVVKY